MTPEKGAYFLLMLRAGQYEEFDEELNRILDQEDPISEPALSIATCWSDRQKTIDILSDYLRDHPADEQQVCDMVAAHGRECYASGRLTRRQTADLLAQIVEKNNFRTREPWQTLLYPDLCCWHYEHYLITERTYEACFDAWALRGEEPELWEIQRENRKKPRAYWVNVSVVIGLCVMSFVSIFITLFLTGGREMRDFTEADQKIFAGFVLCELAIVVLEFYFAARCSRILNRAEKRTAP